MTIRGIQIIGTWTSAEIAEATRILAPLPPAWVERNPNFRALVRRPVLTNAPEAAPGHSKYEPADGVIVVYDKGVYHGREIDPEQFRRSIYHELAHTLARTDPSILASFRMETRGDGYVDAYARSSPAEDYADTFSEFLIDPAKTTRVVPIKAAFIRRLLDRASKRQEKVAMSFLGGFSNELVKCARPGIGRMARMLRVFGRGEEASHGLGKKLLVGGGIGAAGVGGGALLGERHGEHQGEKKGYGEGTTDVMDVAERARVLGRREGVMAYHQALQQQIAQKGT